MSSVYPYFFAVARWLTAAVSLLLIFLWIRYFKGTKPAPAVLAQLVTPDGISLPISAAENIIGRTKAADIFLPVRGIHKKHAVLSFEKDHWMLAPLEGKIAINLQNVSRKAPLEYGDKVNIGGQTLTFQYKESSDISSRRQPGAGFPLLMLTLFQLLVGGSICLRFWNELELLIPISFVLLIAGEWCYYLIGNVIKGFKMLVELPILYLSTLGLAVCACTLPEQLLKQMICYVFGFVAFLGLTFILKHREFCIKVQRIIMLCSVALLYFTAIFGTKINSARNWLSIGGFSFQPSEIVKVAFVLAGAATLYIINQRSIRRWEFLIYAILCMGALALMLDFGAVAIFFMGLLIILTLRLEHPLLISGIVAAAVVGIIGVIYIYPYIARRFGVWLHAWEYADSTGYQQTRTMMSFASGGLLGVGGGNGNLHEIPAAETDLVFGLVGEEWGWIIALTAALCIVGVGFYGFRLIKNATCLFDTVTVGGATVMLLFQSALNIFGSVDMLPLTGVTFIFVSMGGTSLISAWMMFSFFKAAELHKQSSKQWRESE